jgi:hypothetical protein
MISRRTALLGRCWTTTTPGGRRRATAVRRAVTGSCGHPLIARVADDPVAEVLDRAEVQLVLGHGVLGDVGDQTGSGAGPGNWRCTRARRSLTEWRSRRSALSPVGTFRSTGPCRSRRGR